MMKYILVCIRDRDAGVYGSPYAVQSVGLAIRAFSDEVNNPNGGAINKHPDSFELIELGTYCDEDAVFETHTPRVIAMGKDVRQS